MARKRKTYDVFIAHTAKDAPLASEIANAFRASGLETFTESEIQAGENWNDVLWEALAESKAILTIMSPSGPTAWMGIEIGAARAWNKPIYTIVTDPSFLRVPAGLAGTPLYTTGRLQDVIQDIKSSDEEFSDADRSSLINAYASMGVSVDQLALDPKRLDRLVRSFRKERGRMIGGERLLSELLRLRKHGKLHRIRHSASNP